MAQLRRRGMNRHARLHDVAALECAAVDEAWLSRGSSDSNGWIRRGAIRAMLHPFAGVQRSTDCAESAPTASLKRPHDWNSANPHGRTETRHRGTRGHPQWQ